MKSYWSKTIAVFHASLTLAALGAQAQDSPPGGSYSQLCTTAWQDGILTGFCPGGRGFAVLKYRALCEPGSTVSFSGRSLVCDHFIPSLPLGDYLKSCDLMDWEPDAGILMASCSGPAPQFPHRLNYKSLCAPGSTVSVSGGYLVCDQITTAFPRGSFRINCSNIDWEVATSTLSAQCADSRGMTNNTSLEYLSACMLGSEINNSNGYLACDNPCPETGCPPCGSGYGINSNFSNCIACSTLDSNCTTCAMGKCTACARGYSPSDDGSRCLDCRTVGRWPNPYCVACAGGKCTQCSAGFLGTDGQCRLPAQ